LSENNEKLLLNILPASVAAKLKRGDTLIAEKMESVTCFFSDMVGFTAMTGTLSASAMVELLNSIVNAFDDLSILNDLEKIKTIGDAYFCVGGLQPGDKDHPYRMVKFGRECITAVRKVTNGKVQIRVGIHTGPLVAGVIGKSKFAFDCWGDSVNIASRMESTGVPGRVQISRQTYERVHDMFVFEERGFVEVKGKGALMTYLVVDKQEEIQEEPVTKEEEISDLE
jgi:guanylate cyclase 2F